MLYFHTPQKQTKEKNIYVWYVYGIPTTTTTMGRRKRVGGAVGAAIGAAGKAAAPQGRPRRKKIRAKLDMRKMCLLDNILKRGWMLMDPEETDDEEEEDEGNKRWNFYWATVQTGKAFPCASRVLGSHQNDVNGECCGAVRYIFHEKKSRLRSDQRINHFPSHFELTRKDLLVKHCKQYRKDMERKGLPCPEIVPITYYLPQVSRFAFNTQSFVRGANG